ncbi:hypothetical protein GCM10012275_28400 [Longimycelium tulufanense]|uniref:Uncharacterized protein n=1 Tax=Longimycelium tulufanense TaxID=907463 RepID=A0A8J3C8M1_9PSEU|nr:hypothetical protein [Longimycelium tulufanense]GGM55611.1 hypothetical protein GCM10012275_28400 [Longimycelium tulufanense]
MSTWTPDPRDRVRAPLSCGEFIIAPALIARYGAESSDVFEVRVRPVEDQDDV